MQNFDPLLWPCPTPGRYDLIKFDSTLYQEALRLMLFFGLEKIFNKYSNVKL